MKTLLVQLIVAVLIFGAISNVSSIDFTVDVNSKKKALTLDLQPNYGPTMFRYALDGEFLFYKRGGSEWKPYGNPYEWFRNVAFSMIAADDNRVTP